MSRTMGLVAGTGVLTAGGAVVVRPVAGSVVVVVAALEERVVRRTVGETAADTHAAAAIAVSEPGLSLSVTAAERHGDGVALGVATAHRLTPPVLSHFVLLLEPGRESQFSAKWSVSSPMALGETLAPAIAKADIYQYWNTLSSDFTKITVNSATIQPHKYKISRLFAFLPRLCYTKSTTSIAACGGGGCNPKGGGVVM